MRRYPVPSGRCPEPKERDWKSRTGRKVRRGFKSRPLRLNPRLPRSGEAFRDRRRSGRTEGREKRDQVVDAWARAALRRSAASRRRCSPRRSPHWAGRSTARRTPRPCRREPRRGRDPSFRWCPRRRRYDSPRSRTPRRRPSPPRATLRAARPWSSARAARARRRLRLRLRRRFTRLRGGVMLFLGEDLDRSEHRDREDGVTRMNGTNPRRPGKSGFRRGITSATSSEKAMKTAAVPARPSF